MLKLLTVLIVEVIVKYTYTCISMFILSFLPPLVFLGYIVKYDAFSNMFVGHSFCPSFQDMPSHDASIRTLHFNNIVLVHQYNVSASAVWHFLVYIASSNIETMGAAWVRG